MPTAEEMNRTFDSYKYWAEHKDYDAGAPTRAC